VNRTMKLIKLVTNTAILKANAFFTASISDLI